MSIYSSKNTPPGFYVYAFLRQDGSPYYIGKGHGDRAFDLSRKNSPKNLSRIIIMECDLTEIGALALERRYIRWYGRKDIGTGILRNLTDGGEGTRGIYRSTETRKRMSESQKGNPNRFKGTTNRYTQETIDKIKRNTKEAMKTIDKSFYKTRDSCNQRRWMHNVDGKHCRVPIQEISTKESQGWIQGRLNNKDSFGRFINF